MPQITWKSWAMVFALGLVWGGTFLVTELALEGMTPMWLAAGRIGFGALATGIFWLAAGARLFAEPQRAPGVWATLLTVAALSSAVPFILLAWGQQFVTAGFAGVSMAAVPLIVLPLAHYLVPGERLSTLRLLGFVIGFAGVALLVGAQAFESSGAALEVPGRIACFGAAACYAVSSILMRRLPAVDPIGLSTVLLAIAALIVLPLAWIAEGPLVLPEARFVWIVAFLGLVPTAAANLLRVLVIRSAGPVFLGLVNYQVPLFSVLLGGWILAEPMPPSLFYAMAMILFGVGLSQWSTLRPLLAAIFTPRASPP